MSTDARTPTADSLADHLASSLADAPGVVDWELDAEAGEARFRYETRPTSEDVRTLRDRISRAGDAPEGVTDRLDFGEPVRRAPERLALPNDPTAAARSWTLTVALTEPDGS